MIYIAIILALIGAYLVGSIPTGYWYALRFFGIDVTEYGSGNTGATNVARVLGNIKYFFLIFFIDAGKAIVTLWVVERYTCSYVGLDYQVVLLCSAAACLLIGNGFSIFLRGRGGKSVATLIGVIAFLYPWSVIAILLGTWGVVFALSRKVFIASMSAAIVATVTYWIGARQHGYILGVFLILATVWLIWRHSSNIKQFFAKE